MQDFRELKVWQKAHQLALAVYSITRKFPREEIYGLTSQMRRAAVSIAANIAEGRGSDGDRTFRRYLRTAMGSAFELEYYFILTKDLLYVSETEHNRLVSQITEVRRMLTSLIQTLKASMRNGSKSGASGKGKGRFSG